MSLVAETATVAWDYTMADIERAARLAVRKHTASQGLDYSDRADCAWHGVVEALYTAEEPPSFFELLRAGFDALSREVRDYRRHHGILQDGFAPKFDRYWLPVKYARTDGFTDRLVEVLALADALGVLTGDQYEALVTLAAYDGHAGDAAAALGLEYHCFYYRVASGRKKIKAVWLGDETPVVSKPTGETCRVGHSRAEHGRQTPGGQWECRVCRRAARRRQTTRSRQRKLTAV